MRSHYGLIETRPVAADETMILRQYIGSSPAVADGAVYMGSGGEPVCAVGLTSGRR
jgi:hypothetical protein